MSLSRNFLIQLVSIFFKNPKLFLIALLCGGLFYSYELFYARPLMSYQGVPKSLSLDITHFTRTLRNDAYMVGYSDMSANPLWVVYKLTPKESLYTLKRPDSFKSDWRGFNAVSPDEYSHSGFDRGHMAPNHAIAALYGKHAQEETFLMTNITPQRPTLNQKVWQELEMLEFDTFRERYKALWVYTGPIFNENSKVLKNNSHVLVPEAFYKIYVGIDNANTPHMLAFIIPQDVRAHSQLQKYIVRVRDVENATGLNFFYELNHDMEEKLETSITLEDWF